MPAPDAPRLSGETLAGTRAALPAYERARLCPGIVHVGVGNFHRAHQAVYIDDCLAREPDWAIRGISLRSTAMAEALAPQDGLYTLAVRDGETARHRVIGALLEVIGPERRGAVMDALCAPATRIVTLTVTEKGYGHDPASGALDTARPEIATDLAGDGAPRSVPGLLTAALARRRAEGAAPFTALSCDNLSGNGALLRRVVVEMAEARDRALARWIAAHATFPASMVDRIVPATRDADRTDTAAATGRRDAWPVATEPFSQWVVEDSFCAGRPDLGAVGVQLVADAAPFEMMKLRMLNGAHSALAYLGQIMGLDTVAGAMADPALRALVRRLMRREAAPTLDLPEADLDAYAEALIRRFDNTALRHRTAQIAEDGSAKIPQRWIATLRAARAPTPCLRTAIAGWLAFVVERGGDVTDPMAARLRSMAGPPESFLAGLLDLRGIFGEFSADAAFRADVTARALRLLREPAGAVLRDALAE